MISTINDVEYDESIWLKLSCGCRDNTMYVGCILFAYSKHTCRLCAKML